MSRADRRRAERSDAARSRAAVAAPRATPATAPRPAGDPTALALRAGVALVAAVFFVETGRFVAAKITWYLAVDQFGYLQFAHDLLHGTVFHEWAPARALGRLLPAHTDVLMQTYVWDDGRMYCRYAPGFPILLAGWIGLFGDMQAAYLNPTVFLLFLAALAAFEWRLNRSPWCGLVVVALVMLCPTMTYFWALTLTRDLSVHLFAFAGLFLLLPAPHRLLGWRRVLVAFAAIGFAASIRNDAVLYLIPTSLLLAAHWVREPAVRAHALRLAAAAAAGLLVGLLPTLAYNTVATGNPFVPTQGMELRNFFPSTPPAIPAAPKVGYPSSLWHGGTAAQVQGGGLRLSNVPITLRAYGNVLSREYGTPLLALAGLGVVTALVRRPLIVLLAVPYGVAALLFYSGWVRPDHRYIIGVYAFMPVLITEGVFGPGEVVRLLARRVGEGRARTIAAALAVVGLALTAIAAQSDEAQRTALSTLWWLLPLAATVGLMGASLAPRRRMTPILAPVVAIAVVGFFVMRAEATISPRAPFQKGEMLAARATLRDAIEPRSVVITTEDIGRPAENIEHYTDAHALYLTDLERWHVPAAKAALAFIWADMRPYLLLPSASPARARIVAELEASGFVAERVRLIRPDQNMQYFVASPSGEIRPLDLLRVSYPKGEEMLRMFPTLRPRMDAPPLRRR